MSAEQNIKSALEKSALEKSVVNEVYDAINRNDIPAAMKLFDPQAERTEPEGFPAAGTFRGLAKLEDHFSQARATWAEGACKPERLVVSADKVVALVHVRVRLKSSKDWVEGRLADVFTFRNGKIIEMRTFLERKAALAYAGVKDSGSD